MLYFNISDYINQTHKVILLSASYLSPMCRLSSSHAEDGVSKNQMDQSDEITFDPELKLIKDTRAPPLSIKNNECTVIC